MRIALVATGTRGDVGPAIAVASRLQETGHEVLLLASPPFGRAAENHGVPWREIGWDHQKMLAEYKDLGSRDMNAYFKRHRAEQSGAEIGAVLENARDAEVIVGLGVPLGAQTAAEYLEVPYRFVAYSPVGYRSSQWGDPILAATGGPVRRRVSWMLAPILGGAIAKSVNPNRVRLKLAPYRNAYDDILDRSGRPILAAHEALAPIPDDVRERIVACGAIRPLGDEVLSQATADYLTDGEPPIFVGFGSLLGSEVRTLQAIADAVRQAHKRAIFSGAIWDAVELPPDSHVCGAEPHGLLFPRVAAVVNHGGAGTVAQALWGGRPQVVIAGGLDQPFWGRATVSAGVAPTSFNMRSIDVGALAQALISAVEGPYSIRAQELATEVGDSDGAADVVAEITGGSRSN